MYVKIFVAILSVDFAVTVGNLPFFFHIDYCLEDCKNLGWQLSTSLNTSVDPCDDFYEYSCGGWKTKAILPPSEPLWNHWEAVYHKINNRLSNILKLDDVSGDIPLHKAQKFYSVCIKRDKYDEKYRKQMVELVKYLGNWPLIENESRKINEDDVLKQIVEVTRTFGLHPLLKIHYNVDLKNTTRQILYIEQGTFVLPNKILKSSKQYKNILDMYKFFVENTAKHYFNKYGKKIGIKVTEMIEMETKLMKYASEENKNLRMSISELYTLIPLEWIDLFRNLTMNFIHFDFTTTVSVNVDYLKNVLSLVQKNTCTASSYVIWTVIKEFSRETTSYMRHLNFLMDKLVLGVKTDVSNEQECVNTIINQMSLTVLPKYVDLYFHYEAIKEAEEIIDNIKKQFIELIRESEWLTLQTKILAVEKILAIKSYVGYPKNVNQQYLNNRYSKLNITDNHLNNIIEIKKFNQHYNYIMILNETTEMQEWSVTPFDVNAYYNVLKNSIIIPLGLLQPPFFYTQNLTKFRLFNYAGLGSLIGHEISHSLDTIGRRANKMGNIINWWSEIDNEQYELRVLCFERQTVNNKYPTTAEDISDSVGLKISQMAYTKLKLRGFEGYMINTKTRTQDEFFFIYYAQLWCEISNKNEFVNDNVHSPANLRVLRTLHNNYRFKEIFHCKMDNDECSLW